MNSHDALNQLMHADRSSIGKQGLRNPDSMCADKPAAYQGRLAIMAMAQERLVASSHWSWNPLLTLRALWGESVPRHRHLDVASLPEHLKRDMGFLDGNDPSCKHR